MKILGYLFALQAGLLASTTTLSPSEILIRRSLASSVDASERARLMHQLSADRENTLFTPNLEKSNVLEDTEIGRILLGRRMYSGYASSIFHIRTRPDLLIKYQVQCSHIGEHLHPAMREAWYMSDASRFDLAPAIISVSPPANVSYEQEGKCLFRMPRPEFEACEDGIVRYTIMKKLKGYSVREYRRMHALSNGQIDLRSGVALGAAMVRALERLHLEAGVVHGNINAENILMQENGAGGNFSISFVDFKMAFKYSQSLPEDTVVERGAWRGAQNTHWQIQGYSWSARDDLYKVIHLVAHLINPRRYHDIELMLQRVDLGALEAWKQDGNIFRIDTFDPVEALGDSVSAETKRRIRDSLEQILLLVRNAGINDRLPYREVIRLFYLCGSDSAIPTTMQDTTVTPI